jgi:hypothetical protein
MIPYPLQVMRQSPRRLPPWGPGRKDLFQVADWLLEMYLVERWIWDWVY